MMHYNTNMMWGYWFIGVLALILIAIFVASDAIQFGQNGFLWALVVMLLPMMGILVYVVVRSTWTSNINRNNNDPIMDRSVSQTVPPRREHVNYGKPQDTYENNPTNKITKDTHYCTSCGTENNKLATYCNNCGVKF